MIEMCLSIIQSRSGFKIQDGDTFWTNHKFDLKVKSALRDLQECAIVVASPVKTNLSVEKEDQSWGHLPSSKQRFLKVDPNPPLSLARRLPTPAF